MSSAYHEIQYRLSAFGSNLLKLIGPLKSAGVPASVIDQLVRSGTGVGANYAEARAAESPADFRHKLQVALKECRETKHWLQVVRGTTSVPQRTITEMLRESDEFCAILYSSLVTTGKLREVRKGHGNGP